MSMPFYVSPEQLIKDKADYARKGSLAGVRLLVLQYGDGILFVAENPSRAPHKISEIYDRSRSRRLQVQRVRELRQAGVRFADMRGYSYDRSDVTARSPQMPTRKHWAPFSPRHPSLMRWRSLWPKLAKRRQTISCTALTFDGSVATSMAMSQWADLRRRSAGHRHLTGVQTCRWQMP